MSAVRTCQEKSSRGAALAGLPGPNRGGPVAFSLCALGALPCLPGQGYPHPTSPRSPSRAGQVLKARETAKISAEKNTCRFQRELQSRPEAELNCPSASVSFQSRDILRNARGSLRRAKAGHF